MKKTGIVLAATAAAAFLTAGAVSTFTSPSYAAGVKCVGGNACKGMSSCKGGSHACKGMNACKGQGWLPEKSAKACEAKGGTVAEM